MNELSLFTGAGGGLLGTHLLGWVPVGYVEFNDYCQRVLAARIQDGYIPDAPIFGDIRAFISEGYAEAYQGMVDVITAGFPCQPFSVAGKRAGADDERNMWPATIECVRQIRPRYCYFENVPGLITSGYFEQILCDLSESGYSVRWRCLSAAEVGAPHKRDRLWIVANSRSQRTGGDLSRESSRTRMDMERNALHQIRWNQVKHQLDTSGDVAHANGDIGSAGSMGQDTGTDGRNDVSGCGEVADTPPVHAQGCNNRQRQRQSGRSGWWETEPSVGILADELADWLVCN